MAKKPEDPQLPQPDDSTNPRKKPQPEDRPDSDSAIDFSPPPAGELGSGISVIEWASLVEKPEEGGSSKTTGDSSPDANPFAQMADQGAAPMSEQDVADLLAEADFQFEDEPAPAAARAPAPPPAPADDEEVFLAELEEDVIDLSEASAPPPPATPHAAIAGAPEDSAIDLGPDALVEEEPVQPASASRSDSAIDLSAPFADEPASAQPHHEEEPVHLGADSDILGLSAGEPGVERTMPMPAPAPVSEDEFVDLTSTGVIGESSAAIDLGEDAIIIEERAGGSESAIDLAGAEVFSAEDASESAIDLADAAVVSGEPISDVPIDLAEADVLEVEEAHDAIDLVSPAAVGSVPAADDGSAIDLSALDEGSSSGSASGSGQFVDEDIVLETTGKGSGGSARDLIAEELESGVNLLGAGAAPSEGDEDAIADDFLAAAGEDPSSSVDLGSLHAMDIMADASGNSAVARPSGMAEIDFNTVEDSEAEEIDLELAGKPSGAMEGSSHFDESGFDESVGMEADEPHLSEGLDEGAAEPTRKGAKAAADEEVEEEAPKKKKGKGKKKAEEEPSGKQRKPSKAGAWAGGTFLGVLLGAGACAGAWFAGLIPPASSPAPAPRPGGGQPAQVAPQVTFDTALAKIQNGDLEAVTPEELGKLDEANAKHLVARAEYNWLKYVRTTKGANPAAPLKDDSDDVKKVLEDLDKAIKAAAGDATADALFLRGQIREMTGKPAEAQADYAQGAKAFAANPQQKARFETAILLLQMPRTSALLVPPGFDPRALALVLLALQDPMGMPPVGGNQPPAGGNQPPGGNNPQAPPLPEEAGHSFWKAVKLARENNLGEALKMLDQARRLHDQRRYLLPRKQQNPQSDPREEIFLRCADDLKNYWLLWSRLNNPNYLTAKKEDRIGRVDELLQKVAADASAATFRSVADRLAKDKKIEDADALARFVEGERKAAEAEVEKLKTQVGTQTKALAAATAKLEEETAKLKKKDDEITRAQAAAETAKAASNAATALLREVSDAAGSDFKDVKSSREDLVRDVREVAKAARVTDPMGTIKQLRQDLRVAEDKLTKRRPAEEMLGYWVPVLQYERERPDLARAAREDVRRVLDDATAKQETKGKAMLVEGLVLRNEEKFAESAAALEKAREALLGAKGDWLSIAEVALREVKNPAGEYSRKAQQLSEQGKAKEAAAEIARGLKTSPERKGELYLQRARIGYEAARAAGPLKADDPQVKAAQDDALTAAKEKQPAGYYLAGLIAEELGDLDSAEKHFREAIAAHGKNDAEGSRYRIALARVLVKRPAGGKRPVDAGMSSLGGSVNTLALLVALTLQPPAAEADREADRLADEVLALGDKAPFDARAQALAIKGRYTEALAVYARGLRDNRLVAPEHGNALVDLINRHPGLRRGETASSSPDPVKAEKRYSSGLNFFFNRKFAQAEREFQAAVDNDNADARYYYYLGLSRLAQGKREAQEDFDQGARLEEAGKPGRAAVSAALERVQGRMRRVLNDVRSRPLPVRSGER